MLVFFKIKKDHGGCGHLMESLLASGPGSRCALKLFLTSVHHFLNSGLERLSVRKVKLGSGGSFLYQPLALPPASAGDRTVSRTSGSCVASSSGWVAGGVGFALPRE